MDAVLRPESMSTSETALIGRRNAVGDVNRTAQLKWLRLRELLNKRSVAASREPSPSPGGAVDDGPGASDSKLGRLRRAVPGLGRGGGEAASGGGGQRALLRRQTSFDSYVTAPSVDSEPQQRDRRCPAARHCSDPAGAPDSLRLRPRNELPLLDVRLASPDGPAAAAAAAGGADFDFDPFDYELDATDSDDDVDAQKVTVPVTICLVIIGGYIFAGAVLFTLWEDWDYLTGSYFCFITLSTIGFAT